MMPQAEHGVEQPYLDEDIFVILSINEYTTARDYGCTNKIFVDLKNILQISDLHRNNFFWAISILYRFQEKEKVINLCSFSTDEPDAFAVKQLDSLLSAWRTCRLKNSLKAT